MSNVPFAYVLINCDLGSEESIIKEISGIEGVKAIKKVTGVYDIIVDAESDSNEALKNLVTSKIKGLPKVRSTITLFVTKS